MRWIVAAALVIAGTGLAGANEASGTLVVVGDGVIAVTPDMATIQVGIRFIPAGESVKVAVLVMRRRPMQLEVSCRPKRSQ
ncbi:MAG: hypothetical protein AAGP08_04890, partial [Pseudomonadota bacterium]